MDVPCVLENMVCYFSVCVYIYIKIFFIIYVVVAVQSLSRV